MELTLTLGLGIIVAGFGWLCYQAGREDYAHTIRPLIGGLEKRIMAQLDDLKVALADVSAKVVVVGSGVDSVALEVAGLLELLQNHPQAPDLGEVIASAQGISAALDGLGAKVKAVGDAIPDPAPAPPSA